MKYQLIIEGKELTTVSQSALKWFCDDFLNGSAREFKFCDTNAVMVIIEEPKQFEMF